MTKTVCPDCNHLPEDRERFCYWPQCFCYCHGQEPDETIVDDVFENEKVISNEEIVADDELAAEEEIVV